MKLIPALLFAFFYITASSQISWNYNSNISTKEYGNLHPRMAMDRQGNPLVIWGRMNDQSVFFTRWNGTNFTVPVKLNGNKTVASATWMGAHIAAYGDTVYVVMKETPEANATSHIFLVYSYDAGKSFSAPIQVDQITDSLSRFPTVTCDATGNPIVAFMKFNPSFLDSRWVVTRSTDYGKTFLTDTKASGWGNSPEVCDCCPGALVSSGNNCMMLYRDNNADLRDIWTGFSTNNGMNFTNGINIDRTKWMIKTCPSTGPDGVVIGDTLYAVFCSAGGGYYRTYLSKTSISNAAWGSTQNLTGAITGLTQQNYPRIASYGNAVGIVWKQNVTGVAQLPLLFTNDISKGFPVAYDTIDLSDITNTDIALGHEKIAVCWEDDNAGTVKIRIGNFKANTAAITTKQITNSVTIFPSPANHTFTIQTPFTHGFQYVVSDAFGKIVLTGHSPTNLTEVVTSLLSDGVYFVSVYTHDTLIETKKMIFNK